MHVLRLLFMTVEEVACLSLDPSLPGQVGRSQVDATELAAHAYNAILRNITQYYKIIARNRKQSGRPLAKKASGYVDSKSSSQSSAGPKIIVKSAGPSSSSRLGPANKSTKHACFGL